MRKRAQNMTFNATMVSGAGAVLPGVMYSLAAGHPINGVIVHIMAKPLAAKPSSEVPSIAISIETATSWGRRIIAGILDYAREHGPWHVHIEPQMPDDVFRPPEGVKLDGIIARVGSSAFAESLKATRLPVVNVSSIRLEGHAFPRVIGSLEGTSRFAADLFRSRGFVHYAYVGNPAKDYVQTQFHAFERVLGQKGFTCAFFNQLDRHSELIEWLRSLPKPVAVLCWGPSVGRRVIDGCLSAGIAVPHDVAVLGSDYDELLSEASYPPQSGVRFAGEQIGSLAASILDGLMHGRKPAQTHIEVDPLGVVEKLSTDTLAVPDARMAEVIRFILKNSHEPISVDDVLKANPMARRSMERRFRKIFGCSVAEQIRQVRLNQARLMLAGTNEPITLIAEKCGFASYTYLSRVFKESTGMSPRDFRARSRSAAPKPLH
jgi:LacI family transcriptional regulator